MPSLVAERAIRATDSLRLDEVRRMWTPARFARAFRRAKHETSIEMIASMIDTTTNNLYRWAHGVTPVPHAMIRIDIVFWGLLGPDWLEAS